MKPHSNVILWQQWFCLAHDRLLFLGSLKNAIYTTWQVYIQNRLATNTLERIIRSAIIWSRPQKHVTIHVHLYDFLFQYKSFHAKLSKWVFCLYRRPFVNTFIQIWQIVAVHARDKAKWHNIYKRHFEMESIYFLSIYVNVCHYPSMN